MRNSELTVSLNHCKHKVEYLRYTLFDEKVQHPLSFTFCRHNQALDYALSAIPDYEQALKL